MSSSVDYPNEVARGLVEEIIKKKELSNCSTTITIPTSKGDNFSGLIFRVVVTGTKPNGDCANLSMILKTVMDMPRDKFPVEKFYKREYECYTQILPKLDGLQSKFNIEEKDKFKYIKLLQGDLTYGSESLILDDINQYGYKMYNRQISMTVDHLKLAIKELAALHASSFALKKYNREEFEEYCKGTSGPQDFPSMFKMMVRMNMNKAIEALDDPTCRERLAAYGDIGEKFYNFISPEKYEPYTVLCHGDCWTNNMLFRYEGEKPVEVMLLDWQLIKHAAPITDLAYLIFVCTDEQLRIGHLDSLLDFYYETLKTYLVKYDCDAEECYPESVFRDQVQQIMPHGLIMAILTAPAFMSEADDIEKLQESIKKETFDEEAFQMTNAKSIERYNQRICSVVKDCIRLNYI